MHASRIAGITVFVLLALQFGVVAGVTVPAISSDATKQPIPIRQGPIGGSTVSIGTSRYYWFQEGAFGDSNTKNSIGVNVTIQTVYDKVNQDAHSYWVGSLLANGAFVQVGYLNGLSTTNQPYCCAWFYEFFPSGNTISPPVIGPEGSAGPIGSWHTYSMIAGNNSVWSFYFDNNFLGSTPSPGQSNYLGSNAGSTGNNTPAAIAEVAQTLTNTDVIGPAEFKNPQYETSAGSWNLFASGLSHIGYGATSLQNLPNPYGIAEIEATDGDFLVGSGLPQPAEKSVLWPMMLPLFPYNISFSFIDVAGNLFSPTWISLRDGTTELFYSSYTSQPVPSPNTGSYNVDRVIWHTINVATGLQFSPSGSSQIIPGNVFSVTLQVVGVLYSFPVNGATVLAFLPDSTNETLKTDSSGQTILTQLPPSTYTLRIQVPNGISTSTSRTLSIRSSIVAKVISLPELVTIVIPPILIAIAIAGVVARKEHRRQTILPAIPAPVTVPMYCGACRRPLSPGALFCTNCGTPVRTTPW